MLPLNFLSLSAFVTTVTLDMPMAPAANMGFMSIPKKGKLSLLYLSLFGVSVFK